MIQSLNFDQIIADDISHVFNKKIRASVLRLDKIHSIISGNKWFKLRFYIDDAKRRNKKTIVTYGGAWSNHIIATAATCKLSGLKSVGIIRGEQPRQYSPTLQQAREYGMDFFFISREEYKNKIVPTRFLDEECYLINEGGYGPIGAQGAATILDYYKQDFTHCCCAVGTGTMMSGLINASEADKQIIGFSVMKNNTSLERMIMDLTDNSEKKQPDWQLIHDYHFGGYAKHTPELITFMNDFYNKTRIPSDFVYTGKLFYGISRLAEQDFFPSNGQLLIIHSGGLQGNLSLPEGSLTF
jgi:1-aminocyclopropane-1-carboxylate deaminase